jgi:hypothetical protein
MKKVICSRWEDCAVRNCDVSRYGDSILRCTHGNIHEEETHCNNAVDNSLQCSDGCIDITKLTKEQLMKLGLERL